MLFGDAVVVQMVVLVDEKFDNALDMLIKIKSKSIADEIDEEMLRVYKYLLENSVDVPPEINQMINENFWELL